MIAPKQEEVLGVFDLVSQQEADGLKRLLPSVHIIAQKEIVRLRGETTVLEQPQQVSVLTMDITCRSTCHKSFKPSLRN